LHHSLEIQQNTLNFTTILNLSVEALNRLHNDSEENHWNTDEFLRSQMFEIHKKPVKAEKNMSKIV
jgi:hypothetical protein